MSNGDQWIACDSIRDHIHDQGSWVRDMFEVLGEPVIHEMRWTCRH